MESLDTSRDNASRDRDRSRRGDKPSRFSDGKDRDRDRSINRARKPSSNNRVYFSNVSYEYKWQDLKDLFRNQVGDVAYVELFVDENNKPKGSGIIEFSDPASVKKCLEVMHRCELKGRKLVIKEDFGTERDRHGNILSGRNNRDRDFRGDRDDSRNIRRGGRMDNMFNRNMGGDMGGEANMGPTWGLSPQFLESLGINRALSNRVFVANLDYKVDEKKLREIFKLAGKVIDVELIHDKDGKSRGCAIIDFDHPVETVQAISMFHDQVLYDRNMAVRMDLKDDAPLRMPEGLKGIGMGLGVNGEPLKNVSQHLRSNNNSVSEMNMGGGAGAGILGAVPNAGLGNLGSALSNVVNQPGLAGLASLQGLTGAQNQFLANNLNELGLGNLNPALVANSLGGNALSALVSSNFQSGQQMSSGMGAGGGSGSMMGGNQMSQGSYGRGDNSGMFQGGSQGMNRDYNSGNRDYDQSSARSNYDLKPDDFRDEYRQQGNVPYAPANNGAQRSGVMPNNDTKYTSDTVIVTNLSATVSWKMLREKFSCCGDIQYVESKTKDTALIQFSNTWEAEKAIQLLDRARIDGRTIEVRLF